LTKITHQGEATTRNKALNWIGGTG